ncbi:hypothetical protein D9M73_145390 [compost metagenome]
MKSAGAWEWGAVSMIAAWLTRAVARPGKNRCCWGWRTNARKSKGWRKPVGTCHCTARYRIRDGILLPRRHLTEWHRRDHSALQLRRGRHFDRRINLALPQCLRITGSHHAQAKQNSQNPQQIRFAVHRLPPFRQIKHDVSNGFLIGRAAASSLKSAHSPITRSDTQTLEVADCRFPFKT